MGCTTTDCPLLSSRRSSRLASSIIHPPAIQHHPEKAQPRRLPHSGLADGLRQACAASTTPPALALALASLRPRTSRSIVSPVSICRPCPESLRVSVRRPLDWSSPCSPVPLSQRTSFFHNHSTASRTSLRWPREAPTMAMFDPTWATS